MAGKIECNEAGAKTIASELDAGNLVDASEHLRQCLRPDFSTYNSDIVRFAAQVKQNDRKDVGFDVTLHLTASTEATKNGNMLAQLEIR